VTLDCPDPGPLHGRLGVVREGTGPSLRAALAAAARSVGERAPERDALDDVRAQLADHDAPEVGLADARRRVAAAGEAEERLRERVATLRGRVDALTEAGAEGALEEAKAALREATRRLAEAETERIAAEQRLDALEARAREARARREERMALEDRAANLEREARASLAAAVYDRFRAAVERLPGEGSAGAAPGEYEGDPTLAALAVVRVADPSAPVVVATDRLGDAARTARRLDAPVLRAEG
jgi:chromosome segregation ATPase